MKQAKSYPKTPSLPLSAGKRVVIAGDKHQLPPTTFFAGSSETDADEDDDATSDDNARNIESILDFMSIYVRPRSLEWHYRSLDERLIAFSNKEFYGNALITFPSREEPPPAVQHVLVKERKGTVTRIAIPPKSSGLSTSSSTTPNIGPSRVWA